MIKTITLKKPPKDRKESQEQIKAGAMLKLR